MQAWRAKAGDLDPGEKRAIKKNLLRYFHGAHAADKLARKECVDAVSTARNPTELKKAKGKLNILVPEIPEEVAKYAQIVFTFTLASVIVESMFSHMTSTTKLDLVVALATTGPSILSPTRSMPLLKQNHTSQWPHQCSIQRRRRSTTHDLGWC